MIATHSHIVAIRQNGVISGHQLRINGGGPGLSKFFAAGKYGGPEKSERAARKEAKALGLPKSRPRGGSVEGRAPSNSVTKTAGIRFVWSTNLSGPALRVVATWTDKKGRSRHTSYSVDRNGLEEALDLAIASRTSCGAPMPDRVLLLKLLKREKRTRSQM